MSHKEPLAIVGMGCRFPGGCQTPADFWDMLISKSNVISEIGDDRWSKNYYYHPDKSVPGKTYTTAAGQIEDVHHFCPEFFGISPREAVQMDPQQRLLLEMTWEAFEDGGQIPDKLAGTDCSVFVGISSTDYANNRFDDPSGSDSYFMMGNTLSIAANRISHIFDLRGPSMAIDTACSSSLVALHQACASIWSGESSSSLVGAVHLLLSPFPFIGFSNASMLSKNGQCNVFDSDADGYVRSEGGAVLYLKPLSKAQADNDPIQAVILDTFVNSDGRNSGLTIPNVEAQTDLLKQVYKKAGILPADIDYIEAHGTGTPVGDPIEAAALGRAIGMQRESTNPLFIGSVKSNIGHLEPASGMAGLLKVVMALKNRSIPASLNHQEINPQIDCKNLNLKVINELVNFDKKNEPLIMGVNSFGFGGSNAHVILAEHRPVLETEEFTASSSTPPLVLSAASLPDLKNRARQFYSLLCEPLDESDIYDVLATAAHRRARLKYRLVAYGGTVQKICDSLQDFTNDLPARDLVSVDSENGSGRIAFVFSGNGSQWQGMAKDLLAQAAFRKTIEHINSLLQPLTGWSLIEELQKQEDESQLELTEIAQPLLFAIQVGIVEMLRAEGLEADAVVGHSVGEVAAAYAAGILSLESAVKIIYCRSEAQGKTKGKGRMLAIHLCADDVRTLIDEVKVNLTLAAINSPDSVTVSGTSEAIKDFLIVLDDREIIHHELDLDYGFHSSIMDSVRDGFIANMNGFDLNPEKLEFFSTVTGGRMDANGLLDANYWWDNVREPVLFESALSNMIDDDCRIFLEIGPHPVLHPYVRECLKNKDTKGQLITTLRRGNSDEAEHVKSAVFKTYLASNSLDFKSFFPGAGRCVSLPSYPWGREKYKWLASTEATNKSFDNPLLGVRHNNIEGVWTNLIDTQLHDYLADHVVDSTVLFPAAAFIEMAMSASQASFDRPCHEINDFEIIKPMVLEEGVIKETQFLLSADDMRFTIKSRERLTNEEWLVHGKGRLVKSVHESYDPNFNIGEFKSAARELIEAETIYKNASDMGFDYGPRFQGIRKAWLGKECLLAEIKLPDMPGAEVGKYTLHPVIMDSAFHTLFSLINRSSEAENLGPFLPVYFSGIKIHGDAGTVQYCLCNLKKTTRHTVTASFTLLDESGDCVVKVNNCLLKAIGARDSENEMPSLYNFKLIPKNYLRPEIVTPLPSNEEISGFLANESLNTSLLEAEDNFNNRILPLFDALASALAQNAMHELGAHLHNFTIDSLADALQIPEQHTNYLAYLLAMLEQDGKASREGDVWSLDKLEEDDDPIAIWRTLLADFPDYIETSLTTLVNGFELISNLTNAPVDGTDSDVDVTMGSTCLAREHSLSNHLCFKIIEYLQREWPKNQRRLRIAEIRGSNTKLSQNLIARLPADYCDYEIITQDDHCFTEAGKLYKTYTNVSVSRENLSAAELKSKYREGEFDIVIIPHYLHCCDDLLEAFSNLGFILASNGMLLIQEEKPSRIVNLNVGSNPDWWSKSCEDSDARSRLNDADDWLIALEKLDFENACCISESVAPGAHNYLLAARRSLRTKTEERVLKSKLKTCLLLASSDGDSFDIAMDLKGRLNNHGIQVSLACDSSSAEKQSEDILSVDLDRVDEISSLLNSLKINRQLPDCVLYLADIQVKRFAEEKDISQTISKRMLRISNVVNQLNRYMSNSDCQFWLVTANAFKTDSESGNVDISNPGQASIWGMGRVIRNEFPELDTRQIDLQIGKNVLPAARLLDTELQLNDDEEEIVISSNVRHVFRLHEDVQDSVDSNFLLDSDEKAMYSLALKHTGRLESLNWKIKQRNLPKPDEIEIRVLASGLNFRDVMFASGLLPAEMLDSGFAGATLGLECSGIVSAVGEAVTEFSPGDEVIAYAPSCFSSHVLTTTSSVLHKPKTWSFEEGATIPTAFFTIVYALDHLARIKKGERILIHGATGGVGLAAIQYAHYCGAEIFATAGTPEKRKFLRFLGVEHVFDSRTLDFAEQIISVTDGEGVDVILNSLSGEAIFKNFTLLRPFGRFLELGKRDFYENTKLDLRPFKNNITYYGIDADQVLLYQPELSKVIYKNIMQYFEQGIFRPLAHTVYPAIDVENAFRFMQKSSHVGKIVLSFNAGDVRVNTDRERQSLHLDSTSSYLITGGLSGFGLQTARWMVERGAKHLVLIGRSGTKTQEDEDILEQLISEGIDVKVELCDVCNAIDLQKVLRCINDSPNPLKGIVHAAMVIDDCTINNLTPDSLGKVLPPKILGAWNLHNLTLDQKLDFFVLYSSATTCIGNPGQAGYVTANFYLESLARFRNESGLPGLAISWDAITDSGYLARKKELREKFVDKLGINGISTIQAFRVLEQLLVEDNMSHAIAIKANWGKMKRSLPIAHSHVFTEVMHGLNEDDMYDGENILEILNGLDDSEKQIVIVNILITELSRILHISEDKIEHNRPVQEIGVDSLMGMELATAIHSRFGVDLPLMVLTNNITVDGLAKRLINALKVGNSDTASMADNTIDMISSLANTHAEEVSAEELENIASEIDTKLSGKGQLH